MSSGSHDPSIYPEPFEVKPERYFDKQREDVNPDPETWAFGYGRRYVNFDTHSDVVCSLRMNCSVCPGQLLADDIVFLFLTTILVTFNISNARNLDGRALKEDVEYVGDTIR